ncbi:MAG: hypothetical protein COA36_09110 [Desulfotalea sp.]|nr:MAG: hypothetical protein COA36_09110 [Desulfotalea sp.]
MSSDPQPAPAKTTPKSSVQRIILQILGSLIVLGCAAALAFYFMQTPPKAKPRTRMPVIPLVTITSLHAQNIVYHFAAMGTVTSAREIQITPRVSGEIISLSPEMAPGGYVKTGDDLFSIDPTDYELTILQLQSELAKVSSALRLEMGSQRIAIKEFELLGQTVSAIEKKLMLREPQLGVAKAAVTNAEAKLKRAEINLARTHVTAPFNGVIINKTMNLGSHVSPTTPVAQLVGTDQFWIKTSLPVSQLKWLDIPQNNSESGSAARISMQEDAQHSTYREGRVIRLAAALETKGRMAVVYISVDDPLALTSAHNKEAKLLLGSFVQVTFTGKELKNVYAIDRNLIHENDTIWLLTQDNTLEIKKIEIIARTKKQIYTTTILAGPPRLITSQIPSPKQGTPLQLLQKGSSKSQLTKGGE